jgi:hypothetical protein
MEDFYLIKNGGDLGSTLIPKERRDLYLALAELKTHYLDDSTVQGQFGRFLSIFSQLMKGQPSDDFVIDLDQMGIRKANQ